MGAMFRHVVMFVLAMSLSVLPASVGRESVRTDGAEASGDVSAAAVGAVAGISQAAQGDVHGKAGSLVATAREGAPAKGSEANRVETSAESPSGDASQAEERVVEVAGPAAPEPEPEPEPEDVSSETLGEGPREWWLESTDSYEDAVMDAGHMVLTDERWYCAHWYTEQGEAIAAMAPGDVVHVRGMTVVIDGSFDIARTALVDDVRAEVGDDVVIFQTCYGPGGDWMMAKFGHLV